MNYCDLLPLHYVYTDHIGSWEVITTEDGEVEEEYSFDAWGRRRDPQTLVPLSFSEGSGQRLFNRGYTGHEHLDEFGLINMNGRMYDPVLGRMLSPDPVLQAPGYSQNYDVYGYAFNNPLKYTDPSGFVAQASSRAEAIDFDNHTDNYIDYGGIHLRPGSGMAETVLGGLTGDDVVSSATIGHSYYAAFDGKGNQATSLTNNYNKLAGALRQFNMQLGERGNSVFYASSHVTNGLYHDHWVGMDGKPTDLSSGGQSDNQTGRTTCPNCLDPSTIGKNYFGLSYPGPHNPLTMKERYSYSYAPSNLSEYPAIGHDRRYDRLRITGGSGLILDTKAIGADWKFVKEQMEIASTPFLNPLDRLSAFTLGTLLGLGALPKTLYQLSKPYGYIEVEIWYNYSNVGVTNKPDIHKH